jgi:hypothetical protein
MASKAGKIVRAMASEAPRDLSPIAAARAT